MPKGSAKLPEINQSKYKIKDPKAYDEYLKLKARLDGDPNITAWRTSDPNCVLSMLTSAYRLNGKIAHLPDEERRLIKATHSDICRLKGQMSAFKMKAFGIHDWGDQYASTLDGKKAEIIEYFGRYYSCTDVHKIITKDWGMPCTYNAVTAFRKRHAELIRQRQDEYAQDFSDIKLGYKRSRLEELSYLYFVRKQEFKRDGVYSLPNSREMRELLKQIEHEMEGDKLVIEGDIKVQTEQRIEIHVFNQLMHEVSIKNLILARVSARIKIDPLVLMARLTQSYYKKFNGFSNEVSDDEPIYPSKLIYNFEEIARRQDEKKRELKEISSEAKVLSEPDIRTAKEIKEALIKRIIGKKQDTKTKLDEIK